MVTTEMTTDLRKAYIPDAETEMSRRYLMMLHKWVPTGLSYFEDWPVRLNCGHFFGGCCWYGIDTSPPVAALSAIAASPEYDERITGVSKDELRQIAVKAVRYLCFTHDTGPEDCLRSANDLAVPDLQGTKWGERGTTFFRESQCGYTISKIVPAALILRHWIDEQTWLMLANICADYLDRFGDMAPKSGVYADTQMEENAWTSLGLAASYLFLSRHENVGKWEANAKRWMYSTCSAPQDRRNQAKVEKGATAAQLTRTTFTTLPDYMAENHGMVHPGYTASGVTSTGHLGMLYRLFGRTEPAHAYWNRHIIYDNIKRLTDGAGAPHAVQGMDWPYLHNLGLPDLALDYVLHGAAHLFLKDPDAGYFEGISLALAERIQEGNNGRLVDVEVAEKCLEYGAPFALRERAIAGAAALYVMHRLMDSEAPEPTPCEAMKTKLNGVKTFPHSGFVFHKHGRGQTSLAWRNEVMALPLTREGICTIAPARGTLLGKVVVKDNPPSQRLVTIRVTERDDGFAALMINDLAQETIRQRVLFASLPNGNVLCNETLTALEDCTVERVEQGFLEIMNEDFPKVEGNCDGQRTLHHPGGQETFKGFLSTTPDEDTSFELEHPEWVNLDNRVGIAFTGRGKTVYCSRHYFERFCAIADSLCLSLQDEEREYRAGDVVGELSLLLCPGQSCRETPVQKLRKAESSEDAVCLITDGYLCAGNFGQARDFCCFKTAFDGPIPVFLGTAAIAGRSVEYSVALEAGQAVYSEEVMRLVSDGPIRTECVAGGAVHITNAGDNTVQLRVMRRGREETLGVEPGGVMKV